MLVIADVIFTVAVVSLTAGTVANFQLGIAEICTAANRTAVGVWGLHLSGGGFVGTGAGERNCLVAGADGVCLSCCPTGIGAPTEGYDIQNIFAEEQEVVQ